MHELVNYGMEGMSRLCDAVVRSARRRVVVGRQAAPWGHKLCRNFKYPLYFLPVPKMGAKSRRDGVIAKCEKSRRAGEDEEREAERESVNIFAAKIRSASLKAFRGCRRRLT